MSRSSPPAWRDHAEGLGLFLFIPVVLYLFVRQPEPLAVSLVSGIVLMLGHRFIARPYMRRVAPRTCLWSHRRLEGEAAALELHGSGGVQPAYCLPRHEREVRRFFTFVRRARPVLATGIFLPLILLLGSLAIAAGGGRPPLPLETVTALFQLVVGVTVNLAALGYLTVRRLDEKLVVAFPVHNFFLLGIRALLWIFRVVGLLWIARGVLYFT